MANIKDLVEAGIPFPQAVRALLGTGGIRQFAEECRLTETAVSGVINGSTPFPYENVKDALAERFGVERAWIDEQAALMRQRALERKRALATNGAE